MSDERTSAVRAALDAVPLAAVTVDRDGRRVWANRLAKGMAAGAKGGDSGLFDVLAASRPVELAVSRGAAASGIVILPSHLGPLERLVSAAPIDGGEVVIASFVPLGADPHPGDGDGDELARLEAAVERERANAHRIAELDRLKDDFVATVSHELRTPLAAILGFADLLGKAEVAEPIRSELVARIAASAADMRSMVDNVLDFSALEAGGVRIETERIEVRAAIESALRSLEHQLVDHDVDVDLDDVWVRADAAGLGHVLRNLLANAAKYSPTATTITVRASTVGDAVEISITDLGVGIGEADLPRIFDRFYRAKSAALAVRGSGIGLNIAKRYAELMGATIRVISAPGAGSTFTLVLAAA